MSWLITHKPAYDTDFIDLPKDLQNYAQRRLMDVGCTRAMRYLFITHDRSLPSPFLQQLSEDCWLWL
jgi:superfamily I DNA/RNA helicase